MKGKKILRYLAMGIMLPIFISAAWAQEKPNILVFIADDAGWRDFGCYGNPNIQTPNIDRLAANGIRAEKAFLTSPQCSPSRTSMLTGMFAHTLRTEDLHTPLDEKYTIVPGYLKHAGYYSGIIRKSHIGAPALEQFDYFDPAQDETQLAEFQAFLNQAGDNPFFMWYAFIDPHRAYQEGAIENPHDPDKVLVRPYLADTPETRKDIALYYDEIGRMDRNIGEAIQELESRGLLDNTLIVFITDNGSPFTRAKGTLYDEGIKTPLIFHWPEKIKKPSTYDGLLTVMNLAPTFLELGGVAVPEEMVGRSMVPLLEGEDFEPDTHVFSERNWHDCDEHMRSVRSDSFKLIINAYIEWPHGTAADLAGSASHQSLLRLRKAGKLEPEQSLIFDVPRPTVELYDTRNDPFEFNNLAWDAKYRPKIRELMTVMMKWQEKTDDFPPHKRRRYDNTDRITGAFFLPVQQPNSYEEEE